MPPITPKPKPTQIIYSHPLYLTDPRGVPYLSSSGISDAGSDASNVSQSPAAQMGPGGARRPPPRAAVGASTPPATCPWDGGGSPGSYTAHPTKGVLLGEAAASAWTFGEWAVSRDLRPQLASCALRGSSGPSFSKCINSHVALSEMLHEVTWRGTLLLISAMIWCPSTGREQQHTDRFIPAF